MAGEPTTSDVMADALIAAGVSSIFSYPGDPIIDLMEHSRTKGLNVVLARREGTAAFMAEATAMATGTPGVCLSTLGPGSTALVNGVAAAYLDRVPMIAISGQIATSREQIVTHQVVDHKTLFAPITKWTGRIESTAVASIMRKALSIATAERPGPVHLTIPGDISEKPAKDAQFVMPPTSSSVSSIRVCRSQGGADPLVLLGQAKRPVLLAGIASTRSNATAALVNFAELISAPVVVSPMSKGVFPEDHPLFAGVLDMACNQLLWSFLDSADLIITVGFDGVELIKPWNIKPPVLHVDSLPNTDQIYASQCECIGDIPAILDWLSGEWTGAPRWSSADVQHHRDALKNAYYSGRVSGRLNPTDVVDSVRASFPRGTIATCDVGSHKLLVAQGWQAYESRTVLMSNGLSSMGFGVPAAIAAKIARPDAQVVALVGDGGFAMTATEVRLASAMDLPVVFVVLVDGSLNRIELKQMALGLPSTATRIEDMDLVKLASAMDCDGVRVGSTAELENALSKVSTLTRPLIVEAQIDSSQYESQF